MKLGVCYYPEQWPPERWPLDAQLMRQAGLSMVRLADFAWAAMEPREGEFNWEWLDQVIEILAAEGLQVFLCTPTASPPPWLSRAYPDILPVDAQGRRRRHGSRRHYCPNSATFHGHTVRIVQAMAARYGQHPAVAGWQIDNEFGCHYTSRCYCENCAASFRSWLSAKYETIDALNSAWGNIFWSQVYTGWDEIDPPNLTVAEPNPSHVLDYDRFSSDSFLAYQQLQISTLQPYLAERQLVTTNFMSSFTDLNYFDLARPLDMVTVSSYPTGQAESKSSLYLPSSREPALAHDVGDPYITGFWQMCMRGFKPNIPFWVMEQQCGSVNWSKYNTGVRPGTVRLWTWHAFASGADTVIYFRWRAGLFAQEQMHSGLLHHDASPAEGFKDLLKLQAELPRMSEITPLPTTAQVALLLDYDSMWALRLQPHHCEMDTLRHLFVYYRALQRLGLPADIVSMEADLSAYRLVILPTAYVANEQAAQTLQAFTEAGGTVLLGVRSGFKTTSNLVTDRALPGPFRDLAGITVNDWHALPPGVGYDLSSSIPGLQGPVTVWAEALSTSGSGPGDPDLQILAQYGSGPFRSQAALVEHKSGSGQALYLGWYPDDRQAEALVAHLADRLGIQPIAGLPEGLIASQHGDSLILLNFTDGPLEAVVRGQVVVVAARDVAVIETSMDKV